MEELFSALIESIAKQGPIAALSVLFFAALIKGVFRLRREYLTIEADRDFWRDRALQNEQTAKLGTTAVSDVTGALRVLEDLADRLK